MKKIYSALAFMAISATAFAVNPASMSYKLTEADQARISSILQENLAKAENNAFTADEIEATRSIGFKDANGDNWLIMLIKTGELGKYFSGDHPLTDYPYYGVETIIRKQNAKTGDIPNSIATLLVWPTKYIYEHGLDENYTGEKDYTPVSWDVFVNNAVNGKNAKGFQVRLSDNGGTYFLTPNAAGTAIETLGMFALGNSTDGGTIGGVAIPKGTQFQNGASFIFNSKEDDPDGVIYNMTGNFAYANGQTLPVSYNGTMMIRGFEGVVNRIEIGSLAIWNAGVLSGETDDNDTFFPITDWGPLQQLYFTANGTGLMAAVYKQNDNNYKFDISKVGTNFKGENVDVPDMTTWNYIRGMMFAPTNINMEKPEIICTVATPTVQSGKNVITPVANMMIPAGISGTAWSGTPQAPKYGVVGVLNQYYVSYGPKSQFAIGTTEGFQMNAFDTYNSNIVAACNAKIKYFNNPEDMTKYVEIPSVGSLKFGGVDTVTGDYEAAKVTVANGKIMINAENDANVYVYALNGAMINAANVKAGEVKSIAVEKGAYVVKVGNKATKVIL